jgi:hypothetical protein
MSQMYDIPIGTVAMVQELPTNVVEQQTNQNLSYLSKNQNSMHALKLSVKSGD